MEKAKEKKVTIHFPVDFVIASAIENDIKTAVVEAKNGVPEDKMVKKEYYYIIDFRLWILDRKVREILQL